MKKTKTKTKTKTMTSIDKDRVRSFGWEKRNINVIETCSTSSSNSAGPSSSSSPSLLSTWETPFEELSSLQFSSQVPHLPVACGLVNLTSSSGAIWIDRIVVPLFKIARSKKLRRGALFTSGLQLWHDTGCTPSGLSKPTRTCIFLKKDSENYMVRMLCYVKNMK